MSTYYNTAFAAFYDRYLTGWVRHFAPQLADYLSRTQQVDRSVLDLCCGTGESAKVFSEAQWRVTGLDLSSGMLDIAGKKLGPMIQDGTVSLTQADATDFTLPAKVGACISLDGALNHLDSVADLVKSFASVNAALLDSGQFVFDLFQPAHFRHWERITFFDEEDVAVTKRGYWDQETRRGVLRYWGVFRRGGMQFHLGQTLQSFAFTTDEVNQALASTGFATVGCEIENTLHGMRPEASHPESLPRIIYRAIKVQECQPEVIQ